jgi:serine protease inhibitor
MSALEQMVAALEYVTDRLALHVDFEKYDSDIENWKDSHTLRKAESMLENAKHAVGINVLLALTTHEEIRKVLEAVTERLRLHTVTHSYDDETENMADNSALDDANSALLNGGNDAV